MLSLEAYSCALGPDARQIAVTLPNEASSFQKADIVVIDVASGDPSTRLEARASPGSYLSWHPDGRQLAYDTRFVESETTDQNTGIVSRTYGSRVEIVDLGTGSVEASFSGGAPSWSPDGSMLAYLADRSLYVKQADRKTSRLVVKRPPGRAPFARPVSWSPDGKYLAVNAIAGPMDELLECLVIDVSSGSARSLGTMTYSWGPWLAN
jgi:Tol biopolymer transport system component